MEHGRPAGVTRSRGNASSKPSATPMTFSTRMACQSSTGSKRKHGPVNFLRGSHAATGEPGADRRFSVNMALDECFAHRGRAGTKAKAVKSDRSYMNASVRPALGKIEVRELTKARLQSWLYELAEAPALIRSGRDCGQRFRPAITEEQKRQRKVSANRVWWILRAALNHTARERNLSTAAWDAVKAFEKVEVARVRQPVRAEVRP